MWERGEGVRSTIRSPGNERVTYIGLEYYLTGSQILVCSVSKIVSLQITP